MFAKWIPAVETELEETCERISLAEETSINLNTLQKWPITSLN